MRLASLALLAALACDGAASPTPSISLQSGSGLNRVDGGWVLTSATLTLSIALHQTHDSVAGTGRYSIADGEKIGCGGESLPPTGTASLTGQISGSVVTGRVDFDSDWNPPFSATITAPDTLRGSFMSVDRGGCDLLMVRAR